MSPSINEPRYGNDPKTFHTSIFEECGKCGYTFSHPITISQVSLDTPGDGTKTTHFKAHFRATLGDAPYLYETLSTVHRCQEGAGEFIEDDDL